MPDLSSDPENRNRRALGLAPGAPQSAAGQDARKYSTRNPIVKRLIARWLAALQCAVGDMALDDGTLLDVGTGEGHALERIRPADALVIGVEYREDKARGAGDRIDGVPIVVGDAGLLPIRDASVGVTTCIEVLEHLTDPAVAVRELARVARIGCVVSVPWEPWFRLGNFARGKNVPRLGNDPEHVQWFTTRRLRELLTSSFESVRIVEVFPWLVAIASTQGQDDNAPVTR